ncbi:MAG: phosphate ABC transporter ATP-binding protein [Nitrospirae bacterium]|nr:MAG: phosphate ABC transporter ATP-binding protein [Nitrospirota bacterium]
MEQHATRALPPCLRVKRLGLAYHSRPVLADISLDILPQRITAIVGPSGTGKTSFLTCLNRLTDLIAGATVTGQIYLGELEIFSPAMDLLALRRRIGMIFQKPTPFPFSIKRNLEVPLREHGLRDRRRIEQVMQEALEQVGLWEEVKDRLHQSALSLSGGQQQRLCMARAIMLAPEVLLLDEPCSALDPLSSSVVEDLITRLRDRFSIVMVTHNLAQARRVADTVALFWPVNGVGRLIEQSATEQFFEDPQHEITRAYVRGYKG